MVWLCHDLQESASHAHILELSDVWDIYCLLATEANITIPPSFLSRMSVPKEEGLKTIRMKQD